MRDLIDRKAALDALEKSRFPGAPYIDTGVQIAMREIKALPSAQPELRWIPCSERLPKSRTYCLFTVFEHDSELEATTIETVYGRFDDYGERRYWSWEDEFGECCIEGEEQLDGDHDEIIEKVLAWMPLPELRWIPVTEKLPEEMAVVLVYTGVDGYFMAYFDGICWYHAGLYMMRIYSDVVAWMPLPEPYKGGEQDE